MSKMRFVTAREVFTAFPSLAGDMTAAPADTDPLAFLRELADSPTPEDAVSFCAYLLPRREAVWWACQCVRMLAAIRAPDDERLLGLAELWVRTPEEDTRVEALHAGMAADKTSAATWTALAAAWSGGMIHMSEGGGVPTQPHLTAKAARAAVLMALARVPARERAAKLNLCLEGGQRLVKP
jgi:hypothetical protein